MRGTKNRQYVFCVDIGGSTIKALAMRRDGSLVLEQFVEVESNAADGPAGVIAQILAAVDKINKAGSLRPKDAIGCGVDFPGGVCGGRVTYSPNLPGSFLGCDFAALLSAALKLPVTILNDGSAAALWEHYLLKQEDVKVLIGLFMGTGLGGGVIVDGAVAEGAHGMAGELGHIKMSSLAVYGLPEPRKLPRCGCGQEMCFESLCSLRGLMNLLDLEVSASRSRWSSHPLYKRWQGIPADPADRKHNEEANTLVRGLLAQADQGDELCCRLFDAQAALLGGLLAQLAPAFDFKVAVIGGGVTRAGENFRARFLTQVTESYNRLVPFDLYRADAGTSIQWAQSGDGAAACGAGAAFLRTVGR